MKLNINPRDRLYDVQDFNYVTSYMGRYYGADGDELGEIPISVAAVESSDSDAALVGWLVAETPDETTEYHGVYATEEEAIEAATELAAELDETPVLDEIIAAIVETGYFRDADIVPHVVAAATNYSQGYLLITPGVRQPVGTRWTTNGYLQCDHVQLSADYDSKEQAAEALLKKLAKIQSPDSDD